MSKHTTCSLSTDRALPVGASRTTTLPCFQILRVRRLSSYAHASVAINPLNLPQLEIDAMHIILRNNTGTISPFQTSWNAQGVLFRLSIQGIEFLNDELIRCLALSPALTPLRFIPCPRLQDIGDVIHLLDVPRTTTRCGTRTQGHASELRRHPERHVVLPQLRDIALASSVEAYLESMVTMIHSRVRPTARAGRIVALRAANIQLEEQDRGQRG